jgi:hypothetical protein
MDMLISLRFYAEIVAQLLGFKGFIPPYATAKGNAIARGVNFASGAAGLRRQTGRNLVSS